MVDTQITDPVYIKHDLIISYHNYEICSFTDARNGWSTPDERTCCQKHQKPSDVRVVCCVHHILKLTSSWTLRPRISWCQAVCQPSSMSPTLHQILRVDGRYRRDTLWSAQWLIVVRYFCFNFSQSIIIHPSE